jgi:hypothetical protein
MRALNRLLVINSPLSASCLQLSYVFDALALQFNSDSCRFYVVNEMSGTGNRSICRILLWLTLTVILCPLYKNHSCFICANFLVRRLEKHSLRNEVSCHVKHQLFEGILWITLFSLPLQYITLSSCRTWPRYSKNSKNVGGISLKHVFQTFQT